MTIRAILLCIATSTIARAVDPVTRNGNVCSSTECHNIASELSKLMDPTVDPCEDFYDFACGGFVKSTTVNVNFDYRYIVNAEIREDIAKLIEADINPNEPKTFKRVKKFYKSCVNTVAIENQGLSSIRKHLRDLGGWPVVEGDNWNEKKFTLWRNFNKFTRTKDGEYHISDGLDHCAIKYANDISPSPHVMLGLPVSTILSHKPPNAEEARSFLRKYQDTLVNIAQKLGANHVRAMAEVDEIISFEKKITAIVLPKLKFIKEMKHTAITIAQLNKKYPSVPWTVFVLKCVESSISVTDDTIVSISDPDYYVELLALMATTSKRVQANYVMSKIALAYALFSTEEMRTTAHGILHTGPSPPRESRTRYCVNEAMRLLWQGVAVMYADKIFDKETKDAAKAIVENLKWQMNVRLIAYNIPGKAAWNLTSAKIAQLVTDIAYPDEVLDDSKLYENLKFNKYDYFGNMVRLLNYNHDMAIKQMAPHTPEIDKWRLLSGPIDSKTRAMYVRNSIYIAVDNLRGRHFGKDRPKFMNYGTLGRVVGHEMIHMFFERGVVRKDCNKYIFYCGLRETPDFAGRAQCLIDQYESYQVDNTGTKLDGTKTLSENVADVGGVKLAYDAYTGWAELWPEEHKLPGFEQYSAKQMFWISAAATECQKITPARIRYNIRNSKHTINKFRVIGMFSNMPEFAKDFNCKAISLMNPAKRCDIWQSE